MTTEPQPSASLTPERAARLLRAHAAELENFALPKITPSAAVTETEAEIGHLAADIALLATILADFMETADASLRLYMAHSENLIERMERVDRHLWPDEWIDKSEERWGPDSPGYDEMGQ
jgi:hypothetical protein